METENYNERDNNQNHLQEKMSNKRRLIEALIGAVFIVLLVLIVSLVMGFSGSETETKIVNSFNTYNINYAAQPVYTYASTKPYIIDVKDERDYLDNRYYYGGSIIKEITPRFITFRVI